MDCAFQDGSYPCGYQDGAKLPDCELCHKIRKAGIKEVVEWLKENHIRPRWEGRNICTQCNSIVDLQLEDWVAQLKRWGIEGGSVE